METPEKIRCVKCGKPVNKWTDLSHTALENGIVAHKDCDLNDA